MQIFKFQLNGCTISLGNDQFPGEPPCWKTKVDEYTWGPGEEDLGLVLQQTVDVVLSEPCRVHGRQWERVSEVLFARRERNEAISEIDRLRTEQLRRA